MTDVKSHANLVWSVAERLRGTYKQSDYGKVILPLVVLRRLDQALEPTKERVVARSAQLRAEGIENVEPALVRVAGQQFYNDSPLTLPQLLGDAPKIAINLRAYLDGFSSLGREVVEKFDFDRQIDKLERGGLLYQTIAQICEVDLHPDRVSNIEMGYLFEELIRKFAEVSNETAGEHFTPREVVRLMVNLLVDGDEGALTDPGAIRTVLDCACGTGGMLSEAEAHIKALNPTAQVDLFGQELNEESYAICLADMLVKGQDASHIKFGNSLSQDGHTGESFHYAIANPPFGVDWTNVESRVRAEHADLGFDGRFGPGLPRKSDGQLLFLLHLASKMRPPEKGGCASRSSTTARRSSRAPRAPVSRRSAATSSRTTCWRRSSPCRSSSSTTPASPPTCGCCPTARPTSAGARCSSSTRGRASSRCASPSGRSAARSAPSRSTRSPACTGRSTPPTASA